MPDDDPIPMLTDVLPPQATVGPQPAISTPTAFPPAGLARDALVHRVRADVIERLTARTGRLVDTSLRDALRSELAQRLDGLADELHASLAALVEALVTRAVDDELARLRAAPDDPERFSGRP